MRGPKRRTGRRIPLGRSGVVLLAAGFLTVGLGGCREPAGPEQRGLEVELLLSPDEVQVHESFEARVLIRNRGGTPVTLVSGCSALAWSGLHRGGENVRARGTGGSCFSISASWRIHPGGVLDRQWTVTAETLEGEPLAPGLYVFRVEFLVDLPDVEAPVRVL